MPSTSWLGTAPQKSTWSTLSILTEKPDSMGSRIHPAHDAGRPQGLGARRDLTVGPGGPGELLRGERGLPARPSFPQVGARPEPEEESPSFAATVEEPKKERTPLLDWAGLLRRTFALDVFDCSRCGGRRRVLADVTAPDGVRAISKLLELPTRWWLVLQSALSSAGRAARQEDRVRDCT